jgi:hypothetical protein
MRGGQKAVGGALTLAAVAVVVLAGCSELLPTFKEPEGPANVTFVAERGYTDVDLQALDAALDQLEKGGLSEPEMEAILFMREWEKLARDVSVALNDEWEVEAFRRVARSEETHAEAIKALIDRYALPDPSAATWEGYYVNEELIAQHRQLVRQGGSSLVDALKVGAEIQEISILELREYGAESDDEDARLVYENLLRASRNHLRVFAGLLQEQGEAVENHYLSQSLFDEIVGTPPEPGYNAEESGE